MTGVNNSVNWTQSDAIAEAVSAQACHIVLETSPPDYVEKISRYLESSVRQSRQDKGCNDPAEAESDSGDSLFLTQKPVPEAVRSGRRRHYYRSRSDPASPSDLVESDDDASSSKADKERRRNKYRLPKYSFPFLTQRKWKPRSTLLPVQQNTNLHNYAMGGFFKCVRELWQGYQRGENLESSLPTVDVDGEYISPLSEEEEEKSEDEDIKVVEKKHFVVPLKAKRQQTWGVQLKQQRRRKASDARQENSRGRQWKKLHKIPAKSPIPRVTPLSSNTECFDDGESSCKVLVEKGRNHEHVRSDRNFVAQTETPKTKRHLARENKEILFQQEAREEELCSDSDATVCEPHKLQTSPRQYTQEGREASTTQTETQTDVFHIDDLSQTQIGQVEEKPESQSLLHSLPDLISDTNDDTVCTETRVKKTKDEGDHESVEEGQGPSQEEPEGPHAATCVTVEPEETPSLSEDNRAEPPASQPSDELEFNENNCVENLSHDDNALRQEEGDIPHSQKKKKKKKKKNESAAEIVRQEVDGNLESDVRMEDSVFSVNCNAEDGGTVKKKKKKKRKRGSEDDEDVEQLQSVAEPLDDVAVIQKKKKKRKKEERIVITEKCEEEEVSDRTLDLPPMSTGQLEESGNCLENTAASLESSHVKRKKHKKKQQSSADDACQDGEEGIDVSVSNDALAESIGMPLKKKKKKKKKKTVLEGVDISHTPEENEKVENLDITQKTKEGLEDQNAELVTKKKKKKKKKKKISEISSRNISEDNVAQSDDSVSVRKKEKKRTSSFLVADAEENDAQTHGEPNSLSQSVDARVWGAEKPAVSATDFETESAEVAGNLEEPNDGVRKKKKKRKRKMSVEQDSVDKDHEQDFEEPNKTCRSALPETTKAGVKRKKKHVGDENELVTPVERLESAADVGYSPTDEAVVLKKKKKKKCKDEPCHVIQDVESEISTLNTCSSVSHKKKGKRLTFPMVANDISRSSTMETLNMVDLASPSSETPGNQTLNDRREKKKKKKMKSADDVWLEGKSLTESVELESQKNKKERNKQSTVPDISGSPELSDTSLSRFDLSSSDSVAKNKCIKVKRRLHNPNEDFLTDY